MRLLYARCFFVIMLCLTFLISVAEFPLLQSSGSQWVTRPASDDNGMFVHRLSYGKAVWCEGIRWHKVDTGVSCACVHFGHFLSAADVYKHFNWFYYKNANCILIFIQHSLQCSEVIWVMKDNVSALCNRRKLWVTNTFRLEQPADIICSWRFDS